MSAQPISVVVYLYRHESVFSASTTTLNLMMVHTDKPFIIILLANVSRIFFKYIFSCFYSVFYFKFIFKFSCVKHSSFLFFLLILLFPESLSVTDMSPNSPAIVFTGLISGSAIWHLSHLGLHQTKRSKARD